MNHSHGHLAGAIHRLIDARTDNPLADLAVVTAEFYALPDERNTRPSDPIGRYPHNPAEYDNARRRLTATAFRRRTPA